jgi:hypothetical protein
MQDGSNLFASSAPPRLTLGGRKSATVAQNIMVKAQGQVVKSRRHSASALASCPIRQVYGFLPLLIDSIRMLPHALWLSIIFFHVWVIVDQLCPIARVCYKSFYFSFVEICR